MPTIRQLLTGSLRLINVVQANEVPSSADIDVAFSALNNMLDSWSTEKLSIYTFQPTLFSFVNGQFKYTLGPGGDWDIERPMELMMLYVRYVTTGITTDIPLEKLTESQYASIGVKQTTSQLALKYYDNGDYPLRTVTVWPIPTATRPAVAWLWQPLVDPSGLDQELDFPKGYERALRYALAIELAAEFGKTPQDEVKRIARTSKALIKRLNAAPQIMRGDNYLASDRTSLFNYILGDTIPTNM